MRRTASRTRSGSGSAWSSAETGATMTHRPRVLVDALGVRTAVIERGGEHQPAGDGAAGAGAEQVPLPQRVEGGHHQVGVVVPAEAAQVQEVGRGGVGLVLKGGHQQHRAGVIERQGGGRAASS